MTKKPKIIFCLPGNSYSGIFLQCWTNLINELNRLNIPFHVSQNSSCNIYYVRNMCLGGNVLLGESQIPFDAKLDYTHTMWIDSDMVFDPKDFITLLEHDKNIISGIYKMENGTQYATVVNWDEDVFVNQGIFNFLSDNEIGAIEKENGLFKVNYTGFGWILIKKHVFTRMKYPWFSPLDKQLTKKYEHIDEEYKIKDFTMEDVGFCHKVQDMGFDIEIDPSVKLGHEKTRIIN